MRSYSNLISMYHELEEQAVDEQIVLMCEKGKEVPLPVVLRQFKYLVKNNVRGKQYHCLRQYLVAIFDKQIIDDLEAM